MQQFPNYYQPMNNYQPYNPQQTYMERMAATQNYQPNMQIQQPQQQPIIQQGITGKIVNDFSEITANDVPMDNFGAFFFKNDGTEIQRRVWDAANGSIVKTSYAPISEPNSLEGTNTPQNNFNTLNEDVRALREEMADRFDNLEKFLANSPKTTKPSSRAKKEVNADE